MGVWGFFYNLFRHGSNYIIYPGAFDPRPRQIYRPSDLPVPLDYEEVVLTAKDGVRVRAYVICQPEPEEDIVNSENKGKQREVTDPSADHAEEPQFHDEDEGYAEGSMEDLGLDIFTLPQQPARRRPSRTSRRSSRRSSNATASPTLTQASPSSQLPSAPSALPSKQTSNPPTKRSSTSSTQKTPTTPSSPQFERIPERTTEVKPSTPSTPSTSSTPAKPSVHPVTPTVLVFHGNANDIGRSLPLAVLFHLGAANGCNGESGCRALRTGWKPTGEGWGYDWEVPEGGNEGDRDSNNEEDNDRVCGGMRKLKNSLGAVKCNVVMLSPRGYGNSEGNPCMKGFQRDADAALDYIIAHPRLGRSPIIIYGQSLGGAVAIDLTARRGESIAALIVENTFTSLRAMIRDVLPIFSPVAPFMKAWNSLSCFSPPANSKTTKKVKGSDKSADNHAEKQKSADSEGLPLAARGRNEKQRAGWFVRLFSRKSNRKSSAEPQNLPHGRKYAARQRPKRTLSVYPDEEPNSKSKGKSKKLKRVPSSVAVLMLSGARDGVVPPAHMRALWEAATATGKDLAESDGSRRHEIRTEDSLRRGTTSSIGSSLSETSISDHKVLQLGSESHARSGESEEAKPNVHPHSRLATFVSFPQGNHDDTWDNPGYWGVVGGFLERCMGRFASSEAAGSRAEIPTTRPRRGREAREGGMREGTADSGIGMGIVLGDPRVDALRKDNHQPRKRQSWDGVASRRRESWESLGMHRPATSGPMQVGARVGGSTRVRSRSSSPPSPSIMESLATASAWAAPEEPSAVPKAGD